MNIGVQEGAEEGKSFVYYIDFLADKGSIPPNDRAWVDHIRKKGNEANHEIALMTKVDASELVKFTEMLLKFIYEFPGPCLSQAHTETENLKGFDMDTYFGASDANTYKIQISDEGETISVHLGEQMVGEILLEYRSVNITGYPGGETESYHIISLSLEGCKRIGLGQACLEFHKKNYDLPITAGRDRMEYGESEDGSHLIGDGVGFVSAMRKKHIIAN